jgi:hypothetical protein
MPTSEKLPAAGGVTILIGLLPLLYTQNWFKSTTSLKCLRKSAPSKGKETAANKNRHVKLCVPNFTAALRHPQQGIRAPAAEVMAGPVAGASDLYGITEKTAPVSTRNSFFD